MLRKEFGDSLLLISNICLCDYRKSGSCIYENGGTVLVDKTAEMLAKISLVHVQAGAHIVAPAAMVDGQVKATRELLDKYEYNQIPIMSYIKTNSNLFEPYFRVMDGSSTNTRNNDSYRFRIDPMNRQLFFKKVNVDVEEGVDIILIKPALFNLDFIYEMRQQFATPIAAYHVSGEYSMLQAAAQLGYLDENEVLLEMLKCIKRAGASMILTYYAREAGELMKNGYQ